MKKVQAIDPKRFLQETRKARKVLYDYVEGLRPTPGPDEKVMILKDLMKEAKTLGEKKELEKELEEQRFLLENGEKFPMMPTVHRDRIMSNLEIEIGEVDNILEQQYEQLHKLSSELDSIVTLVSNIKQLEDMRKIVPRIIKYRDGFLTRQMPNYVIQEHSFLPHDLIMTKEEVKGEDMKTVLADIKKIRDKVSKLQFTASDSLFYGGKN